MELELFSNSGRFTRKEKYLDKNPEAVLASDCTDVVEYLGGYIIQLLKSGEFMVNEDFKSRSLDESETYLFTKIINK